MREFSFKAILIVAAAKLNTFKGPQKPTDGDKKKKKKKKKPY